ncbi:outer membrane beta-barrel family protein [soil metagenome]
MKVKSQQQAMRKTNLKKLIVLLFTAFYCSNVFSQYSISGKVVDTAAKPLVNANILLLRPNDSSMVKGTVSNAAGAFNFTDIEAGTYLVNTSNTGFKSIYISSVQLSANNTSSNLGSIVLAPTGTDMATVTIVSKKPMFEQKIDRMVVNVRNSITSAGGTVLDVLQKSPGVNVNKQSGTITMSGKSGVNVMINGKLNYMPADALLQMLNGMDANNVERIELITTPPAKYDAAGNAGYINIVLINNPDKGLNGSFAATLAAFEGSNPSANININYRAGKVNIYGAYSFSRLAQKQEFSFSRKVTYQGKTTDTYTFDDRDPFQRNHNIRLGIDYQLSKKTTIGMLLSGYDNKWSMNTINTVNKTVNGIKDTGIIVKNGEINYWKNYTGNVNLQHTFNSTDDITFNADYLFYDDNNPNNYLNRYYDRPGILSRTDNTKSSKKTIIKILPVQLDYRKKLSTKINGEFGIKAVFSNFTNDVRIENFQQNAWKTDSSLTANYTLKENIAAAYASVNINASKKTTIKAGIRYEHTFSNLGTETQQNIVDRKYRNFFPTFYISHKLDDNNSLNFSYSRRINRPAFTDLAPFTIFLDPNTFITGNSALQPSLADAVKIDYLFKKYVLSAAYTYEANTIGDFQTEVDVTTNKQYLIGKNLKSTRIINASLSLPIAITKWWVSQINLNGTWQKVASDYKNKPVKITNINYNISGFQSFTLPQKFAFEISGFFQSPTLFGASESKAFWQLNAGVQKKFIKNNASLRFGVDDIFTSMRFRFKFDVPSENFYTDGSILFSRRIFKLTYTQNFGNKMLKDKRERITASDDEKRRIK